MMFMAILFSVVLKEAVMVWGPSASQPNNALCVDLDGTNDIVCGVRFPFRDQNTGATLQWQVSVVWNPFIVTR